MVGTARRWRGPLGKLQGETLATDEKKMPKAAIALKCGVLLLLFVSNWTLAKL